MAALTISQRSANAHNPTVNTMSASDTLAYDPKKNQELILRNTTASPINLTIDGTGASNAVPIPGAGGLTVDLSAGKVITVPGVIGACTVVPLDSLVKYLQGTVALTGGTGLQAVILSN